MNISGFQKLTLLDYPNKVACILFTQGCNYKCSYCQNSGLLKTCKKSTIPLNEIFNYLDKRKNVLDGIVISGGEPTIQKDLINFICEIKKYKLLVKLDTNGSNPKVLKELIDKNLIDYVAMDIKDDFVSYSDVTKTNVNIENIKESINILKESKIDHEFRTTIIKNFHNINKIKKIYKYLGEKEKYCLQNFKDSDGVLDKSLFSFSDIELKNLKESFKEFPNLIIRGI